MNVPFDMVEYQKEKLLRDIDRFIYLYAKYEDNVDEILEFAELCKRFYPTKKNKYEEQLWKKFQKLQSFWVKRMLIG